MLGPFFFSPAAETHIAAAETELVQACSACLHKRPSWDMPLMYLVHQQNTSVPSIFFWKQKWLRRDFKRAFLAGFCDSQQCQGTPQLMISGRARRAAHV